MLIQLVEYVVAKLVDDASRIQVIDAVDGDVHIIRVSVAQEDLGKIIGKDGNTARALRTLIQAAAARDNIKAGLEIVK